MARERKAGSPVAGEEAVVPAEFVLPSLYIAQATRMLEEASLQSYIKELMELEEDRFVAQYRQTISKSRQKAWHDRHIRRNTFDKGDLVLLYDSKSFRHPGKLKMHWLGPFVVAYIQESGAVQLTQLDGIIREGWVNGAHLKLYVPPNM